MYVDIPYANFITSSRQWVFYDPEPNKLRFLTIWLSKYEKHGVDDWHSAVILNDSLKQNCLQSSSMRCLSPHYCKSLTFLQAFDFDKVLLYTSHKLYVTTVSLKKTDENRPCFVYMGRVLVKVSCWLGQKERNIFEWFLNTMFTVFFWSSKSCRSSSSYVCTSCVFSYMPNGSNIPFTVCISTSLHETNFLFSAWQSSHLFNLFKSLELQQPFVLVHTHIHTPVFLPWKTLEGKTQVALLLLCGALLWWVE